MKKRPNLYDHHAVFLALVLAWTMTVPANAQSPVPGFSKSFSPATIGPGSISTLRFAITNPSAVGVRNLAFTDTLPAGMTIASPAGVTSTCGGTLTAPEGDDTISLVDGGVGASRSCAITVNVTTATPGSHTNTSGNLTSDAGNSGSASATLTVATDRPGFSKSFSPSSIFFTERSTLTFTIDNSANTAGAANLQFTDTLPTGMVVASPSNKATTCGGGTLTANSGASVISYGPATFLDATVGAGSTCTISVDVLGNAVGSLGNTTGELTSTPQNGGVSRGSGKAGATLTVAFERIALTKNFVDDPVSPGGTVTLQFTIRNLEREAAIADMTFTDDLDAVVSGLVAVGLPLANPCGSGSVLSGGSVLTLTGGNLGTGETCTFSVTLAVPADAPAGTFVNTTSTITGDAGGSSVSGRPAEDFLVIAAVPVLTKTFLGSPAGAGGSVILELTITNTSASSAATDIAFQDIFDVVLPTASSVPTSGFCGAGSTATYVPLINPTGGDAIPARLTIAGASLDPGASCTFSITLDIAVGAATGTYPNTTSEITATLDEGTVTGNPASDDLAIVAAPLLQKEFIDDPVAPGGTVTLQFTLTHDENAPGDATGITFSDDLDAALSGLVATGLPAADVCGIGSSLSGTSTLLLTGGSLSPGESCTFAVSLSVPASATPGDHTNTTSAVAASVLGVDTMTNPASDALAIAGLTLTKRFTDDPALPGGTVTLRFTLTNQNPVEAATDIVFQDSLSTVLSGLAATGLPLTDPCGTGSSLTAVSGNTRLIFQGGSLAAGASCTFDVTLLIPTSAVSDTYVNRTSTVSATVGGATVFFGTASDELTIATDFLAFAKEFIDDPASPGGLVTLRFTLTNLSDTETVASIAFTDDLDAALSGLASVSGTLMDLCGVGSQVSGTSVLSFTGGSLAPGTSCSFNVSLAVPSTVLLGTTATNVTSSVTGTVGGIAVTGGPAQDELLIDFVDFSKAFGGQVTAGGSVTLSFTIENLSATDELIDLSFSDDLNAVLAGLAATGLPAFDVCGEGSVLSGTTFLELTGGNLLPSGSCTFGVTLQVPGSTPAGLYVNATSDLLQFGIAVAQPATASLLVVEVADTDDDGVLDGDDLCPGTVIPESVPTRELRPNRYALIDGDTIFDTQQPPGGGNGPGETFTTTDTAGCSCEQIIDRLGLGNGHTKFGCSLGAMRQWVSLVGLGISGW